MPLNQRLIDLMQEGIISEDNFTTLLSDCYACLSKENDIAFVESIEQDYETYGTRMFLSQAQLEYLQALSQLSEDE